MKGIRGTIGTLVVAALAVAFSAGVSRANPKATAPLGRRIAEAALKCNNTRETWSLRDGKRFTTRGYDLSYGTASPPTTLTWIDGSYGNPPNGRIDAGESIIRLYGHDDFTFCDVDQCDKDILGKERAHIEGLLEGKADGCSYGNT